mgnify:CR=1 FL=1
MEAINEFFTSFSSFLWGWPMIILLLGTHIFLTVRLRFPQRKIFQAISKTPKLTVASNVSRAKVSKSVIEHPPFRVCERGNKQ